MVTRTKQRVMWVESLAAVVDDHEPALLSMRCSLIQSRWLVKGQCDTRL